jgi:hypothetical protein
MLTPVTLMLRTDQIETTYKSADNSERDVKPKILTLLVDDFAFDEIADQTKYDPA